MESIKDVLERLCLFYGVSSNRKLAEKIVTNYNTMNTWIKRETIPYEKLYKIVQKESISFDWLLTGKGEMLNSLINLPKDKQKMYFNEIKTGIFKETVNLVNIPYFEDTYASAGSGTINYDSVPSVLSFDLTFLQSILGINSFHNLHIIKAIGDSMNPLITSGELLFINPIENDGNSISTGGVYVIRYYDDYLVKKLDRNSKTKELTLISENKTYADVSIVGEDLEHCTIIGRVVGHFDRI